MTEHKAGPHLDSLVAIAIGLRNIIRASVGVPGDDRILISSREWDEVRGIEHPTCEGDIACFPFNPSVDLNVAIAAAELVCEDGFALHTAGKAVGGWTYFRCIVGKGWAGDRAESQLDTEALTPALAVCGVILALGELDDE